MTAGMLSRLLGTLGELLGGRTSRGRRRAPNSKATRKNAGPRLRRVTSKHPIADAILEFDPVSLTRPPQPLSHTEYAGRQGLSSAAIRTEADHSNAFLFGVISDRMIKAEKAWELPYRLSERLGHLDVRQIRTMPIDELEHALRTPTGLHRFNRAMAEAFITASNRLVSTWRGAAHNMWQPGTEASELMTELESLPGISHKLSAMTLQILITRMGVNITGLSAVNIAVDRHVARVFLRTGMVKGEPPRKAYRSAELKPSVINAARDLSPAFPAALDGGTFWIGKNWCTHTRPKCSSCPIRGVCPQDRKSWSVGIQSDGRTRAE